VTFFTGVRLARWTGWERQAHRPSPAEVRPRLNRRISAAVTSEHDSIDRSDRCLQWADKAPTEPIRQTLLSIARLCEVDAELVERSKQCLIDSREMIARADRLLRQPAGQTPSPGQHYL